MGWRTLVLCVVCVLAVRGLAQDDAAKKDSAALQGEWRILKAYDNGEKVPVLDIKDMTIKFAGNTVVVREGDKVQDRFTFKLDPGKKPKTIDFLVTEGKKKGATDLGIYALEGDSLKLSIKEGGPDRPKEFASKAGSKVFYLELQRIKK
jgi:uncharacterized protein (TIGR03067 family)